MKDHSVEVRIDLPIDVRGLATVRPGCRFEVFGPGTPRLHFYADGFEVREGDVLRRNVARSLGGLGGEVGGLDFAC